MNEWEDCGGLRQWCDHEGLTDEEYEQAAAVIRSLSPDEIAALDNAGYIARKLGLNGGELADLLNHVESAAALKDLAKLVARHADPDIPEEHYERAMRALQVDIGDIESPEVENDG